MPESKLQAVRAEWMAAERERDEAVAILEQRLTTALTAFATALVPRAEHDVWVGAMRFIHGDDDRVSLGWLSARRRQLDREFGDHSASDLVAATAVAEADRDALLARITARRPHLNATPPDVDAEAAHVEDLQALRLTASRLARLDRLLRRRTQGETGLRVLEDEVLARTRAEVVDACRGWLKTPNTATLFDARTGAVDVPAVGVVRAARVLGFALRCLDAAWDVFLAKSGAAVRIAALTGELADDVWGELLHGRERYSAMARAACAIVVDGLADHVSGFAAVFGAAAPALGPLADGLFLPEVRALAESEAKTWLAYTTPTEPLVRALARLGRYRLDRLLARGGMGEVYDATQDGPRGFTRRVIVKRILAEHAGDPFFIDLFKREAAVVSRLQHQNIIDVYELGVEGDVWFMALEWLDGLPLHQVLAAHPTPELIGRIFVDAAHALAFAHERGVIHRDISPDNLFVTRAGVTKVIDFGIATVVDSAAEEQLRGKIPFMAPELFGGAAVSPAVDVFALGVTLWSALVGHRPFQAPNPQALVRAICFNEAALPSTERAGVPPLLDELVLSMLNKAPERRPSAVDVAEALRAFAATPLAVQGLFATLGG